MSNATQYAANSAQTATLQRTGLQLKRSRLANRLRGLLLPALLIGIWQYLSTLGPNYAYAFIPLQDIARGLRELIASGELLLHIGASLKTALTGLAIGAAAGLFLGSAMAFSRIVDFFFGPLYHVLRQIPTLGLIPLIALWFGNTEFSKILVVSLATFEVMTLSTFEGLRSAEAKYVEVGRVLTFNRVQLLRCVLLPSAVPSITTGLMHAVAFSWLATVGVELLFTVGPGLSVIMERAQIALRMDTVIICIVFIGLLGLVMNQCCVLLSRRVLRWRNTR
ncbi:MAG TPA: ABC transporter permease [Spongiibacteraceae bacterium]|nr:ABC transporter permease [Spongiibacteraceae bacterium]